LQQIAETQSAAAPSRSRLALLAFLVFVAIALVLAWLLNDLRLQLRETAETVNAKLPSILEKTETSAQALAELSEDVRQLRDLAGATGPRDATLAAYADAILDKLEAADATIGTKGRLSGNLSEPLPSKEWVAAARKEAVWLTFRAKSKDELLTRLSANKFGTEWHIQVAGAEPVPLRQWIGSQPELQPTTGQ